MKTNKFEAIQAILPIGLMVVGIWWTGQSAYLWGKATLAQYLIRAAWQQGAESGDNAPPWPWADTWPVAELVIGRKGLMVLAGASGRVLAFGPGWLMSSVRPGEQGNSVIFGHRDTHFDVLERVRPGDVFRLHTQQTRERYEVLHTDIVHMHDTRYLEEEQERMLTIVTCYPFDKLNPDTPWRFVVRARAMPPIRVNHVKEYGFL